MEQRIRNIVFDIGGVLADFRIKEFLSEKGFDGILLKPITPATLEKALLEISRRLRAP